MNEQLESYREVGRPIDEAQNLMDAVGAFFKELEALSAERLKRAAADGGLMTEQRAQLVALRALGRHHATAIKRSKVPARTRRSIENAIKAAERMIPKGLR